MIADPDLTARVIPALVGVQILGVVLIAAISILKSQSGDGTQGSRGASKEWAIWLFGFLAMLYFFRAVLSIFYMMGNRWHKYQIFVPISEIAITVFLVYLAYLVRRSIRRRTAKENEDNI
jgi:hypothetical protein